MSASLHVKGVDHPDVRAMFEIGAEPSIDVTKLRDDERIPDYVKESLYDDEVDNPQLVADGIILATHYMSPDDVWYYMRIVTWLQHMAENDYTVQGMH